MIVAGGWVKGRPIIPARLVLPTGSPADVDLVVDTASSYTIISEAELPKGALDAMGIPAQPIWTIMGPIPAYLVPGCTFSLWETNGNLRSFALPLFFLRERHLSLLQKFFFRRVFGKGYPSIVEMPRNIIGRDILKDFHLLASQPQDALYLTDEYSRVKTAVENLRGTVAPVDWLD